MNLLDESELRRLAYLDPSEQCLNKLDNLTVDEFSYCLHYDLIFHRFMGYVVGVPGGTPEMVAYWLMKRWSTEAREWEDNPQSFA
ncbi:uncharacterized protein BKA55DRAFT_688375 [Fusarium redolens]|uniref:Uncharacterized protein n=1 Tax=Fusarium redolens TaxID=48865 RepID=A0A9P9KJX6_FUSRE|nr:uncharacterized protein BKA55DRAFT_688375 [Fusarium redolens]KAH7255359.1 hypothetical protein BKA55DRAFT_688375 [Fusarium redolens]